MQQPYKKPFSFLIADDDADDQFLLKQAILEVNCANVLTMVDNGLQLIDILNDSPNDHPDFILLDINMPLMDGFSVLSQIRASENWKNIPTFIMSTSRSQKDIEQSRNLGANAFFSKPAQFGELKQIINSICKFSFHPITVD